MASIAGARQRSAPARPAADAAAFTRFVEEHQNRIFRLALRMVGPDAAEDVAQQAFLRAWAGLPAFRNEAAIGTWLYRLAMICCLDHLRRARRFRPRPLLETDRLDGDLADDVVEALEHGRRSEGFIALWWKCRHLGCTVPWLPLEPVEDTDRGFADRGRFKCPCHASQYNRYGQITNGPAPRPMDRFPLRIEGGTIYVDTGPERAISRSVAGRSDATPA